MNNVKWVAWTAIILSLLNIGLMAGRFFHRPPHPPPHGNPKHRIIRTLKFDKKQVEAFEALIDVHIDSISFLEKDILTLKKEIYKGLITALPTEKKDSLYEELGKRLVKIEQVHYHHFEAIKKLCNNEQLKSFETLSNEIADIFSRPPTKRRDNK